MIDKPSRRNWARDGQRQYFTWVSDLGSGDRFRPPRSSPLIASALRYLFVVWYGIGAIAVFYLHLVAETKLGRGWWRLGMLGLGVLSAIALVGALLGIPLGWYAAVSVAGYHILAPVMTWRARFGRPRVTRVQVIEFGLICAQVALAWALLSKAGMTAFGIVGR